MREIYICKEFNNLLEGLANFKNLYPHKMQFNIFKCQQKCQQKYKGLNNKKKFWGCACFLGKIEWLWILKKKGTDNVLAWIFTAPGWSDFY